jgi:hypothetical protein
MTSVFWKKTHLSVAVGSVCLALSSVSHAVVVVGGDNGWEVSFDGNVNSFLVLERPDAKPDSTIGGTISGDQDSARVRTGLLPAVFAFNVRSPIVNGLRGSARIGFYPQVQNAKTKNQFGSQVDFREAFFKVEGEFGDVLMGRALSLFQGKNLLTDMTLFGLGVQGGVDGGGTTLGRIGYGYVYPQFNAGIRYTTPDYSGFKLSAGIFDPSKIAGDVAATETDMPRFETELSYGAPVANGRILGWVSAMTQSADFITGNSVRSTGIAGGISYDLDMGAGFVLSGYKGKGLGSTLMLDSDSLDSVGEERDNYGFLAQATYTMGSTKVGLSYGESNADETRADQLVRLSTGARQIEKQSSVTLGLYHDVNAWLKIAAEYNYSKNEWYGSGGEQDSNALGLGAFFLW